MLKDLKMPGCLRDAAPDAWGRCVPINCKLGMKGEQAAGVELSELAYLLESGSDRIGALDFQLSPAEYVPRLASNATLEELLASAELDEMQARYASYEDLAEQNFFLSEPEALSLMEQQLQVIAAQWQAVCEEAELSVTDKRFLWGRAFLNPFAFDDLEGKAVHLKNQANQVRADLSA